MEERVWTLESFRYPKYALTECMTETKLSDSVSSFVKMERVMLLSWFRTGKHLASTTSPQTPFLNTLIHKRIERVQSPHFTYEKTSYNIVQVVSKKTEKFNSQLIVFILHQTVNEAWFLMKKQEITENIACLL